MFNKTKARPVAVVNTDLSIGTFNGTVVDNADPTQQGRIKVDIPELSAGIPKDKLPWDIGKREHNTSPNAQNKIPPVGSQVIVEFPHNDFYNGMYNQVIVSEPPVMN